MARSPFVEIGQSCQRDRQTDQRAITEHRLDGSILDYLSQSISVRTRLENDVDRRSNQRWFGAFERVRHDRGSRAETQGLNGQSRLLWQSKDPSAVTKDKRMAAEAKDGGKNNGKFNVLESHTAEAVVEAVNIVMRHA